MQLVVVMAVRAAVMAATMTFRITSQMFFVFIVVSSYWLMFICLRSLGVEELFECG